jgi:predicted nucleotidyltransferase
MACGESNRLSSELTEFHGIFGPGVRILHYVFRWIDPVSTETIRHPYCCPGSTEYMMYPQMAIEPSLALIVKRLREEDAEEKRAIAARVRAAYAEVDRLKSEFLRLDPDIEKIILFGSLAEERVNRLDFDIDLAVRSAKYMRLLSVTLDSPFKVDCVDLDNARDWLLRDIEKYGRVIHEKG